MGKMAVGHGRARINADDANAVRDAFPAQAFGKHHQGRISHASSKIVGVGRFSGEADDLDGDIIKDYTTDDVVEITDAELDDDDITVDGGRGATTVSIDTNGDGIADVAFTLIGSFQSASLTIEDGTTRLKFSKDFGILGGESGAPVNSFVIHPDNSEHHFASPGKVGGHTLQAGDTVILQSAGGGGYGDPLEREVERVADDVADGLVSRGTARNVYGVILTTDGFADLEATKVQRDQLRAARITVSAVEDDTDAYTPSGPSKKRVLRLNPEDIKHAGLVDGDRAELLIGDGAPLRGWVRPDATVAAGRVPLDPLGCRALGADASASLILRPLLVPDPGSIG